MELVDAANSTRYGRGAGPGGLRRQQGADPREIGQTGRSGGQGNEFVDRVLEREGVSYARDERANVLVHVGLLGLVVVAFCAAFCPQPIGRIVLDAIGR